MARAAPEGVGCYGEPPDRKRYGNGEWSMVGKRGLSGPGPVSGRKMKNERIAFEQRRSGQETLSGL